MDLAALWAPFSRQLSSPTTPLSTALSNEESKAAEEARRFARHASAALARPSMLLWTHCRSRNSDTAHQDVLREAIELGGAPLPGGQFSSLVLTAAAQSANLVPIRMDWRACGTSAKSSCW